MHISQSVAQDRELVGQIPDGPGEVAAQSHSLERNRQGQVPAQTHQFRDSDGVVIEGAGVGEPMV
jgi:hypothetical protein